MIGLSLAAMRTCGPLGSDRSSYPL